VPQTRVLIADDHPAILDEVRRSLNGEFAIVGAVGTGRDAVDSVLRLNPDVLVTDISMPILDGLQVASALRRADSRTKIVFLTCLADQDYVEAALPWVRTATSRSRASQPICCLRLWKRWRAGSSSP
jgi:DNA-binding NarL/FixJ family response regulator